MEVETYLDAFLFSLALRTLELEPNSSFETAVDRVVAMLEGTALLGLDQRRVSERLAAVRTRCTRKGVINPRWLGKQGFRARFYLVNARPGWFEHLVAEGEQDLAGTSQYILYGDFDALIILYGTDQEAVAQADVIENDLYTESIWFSAKSTPLLYRHEVAQPPRGLGDFPAEDVNAVARDFDDPDLRDLRDRLVEHRVIMGPVWMSAEHARERIVAWVGLALRGRHMVRPQEMLTALRSSPALESSLVHLYETDTGHPYKYFAKLACRDQEELDRATNDIATVKFGQVFVEGTTMIVARGVDRLPLHRRFSPTLLGEMPSLDDVEQAARDMVHAIGGNAARNFNALEPSLKLAVLSGLTRIAEQQSRMNLPAEWSDRMADAIRQFGVGALEEGGAALDGAVTAGANTVEAAAKRAIRVLAETQFGKDYGQAQKELRLPTKNFAKLTLGKILQAFHVIRKDKRFRPYWSYLDATRLEALDEYTSERNRWQHGAKVDLSRTRRVHHSADFLVRSLDVLAWIVPSVIRLAEEELSAGATPANEKRSFTLIEEREHREFGVFVSHSAKDEEVATRISNGLKAFGLPLFFARWSIKPSDSIVQKIDRALARSDTILVLLTPNSVRSQWVKRELNSALMAQLQGHDVAVLPLLFEDCEVPSILEDIKYIDFRGRFEDAFLELFEFLRSRRERKAGSGSASDG